MDPDKRQKAEQPNEAALKRPSDESSLFLEENSNGNSPDEAEILLSDSDKTKPPPLKDSQNGASEKEKSSFERNISHYKILKPLGKGGMGEVFLAQDAKLERLIALKILPADLSEDETRVQRFIREAKAVSALNHPNILTIYEIGDFQNSRFIATEYIEGETLRQRQRGEPLDLRQILDIAAQIAAALVAAHSAGIVHRDIKPENIMIRSDGLVKVLDFGLAKLTEKQASTEELEAPTRKLDLTNPGVIMGTASYMSPEQIRGRADIDARTDIWSLGVVIFEMLTGRVPFTGESVGDVIASILKTETPHLSECVEDCPGELERIVTKSLQKDREERYQVIKDLALDLKSLRRELEFSAEFNRVTDRGEQKLTVEIPRNLTTVAETAKKFSFNPAFLILLLAALLFGGGWWFFGGMNKSSETPQAVVLKPVEVVSWAGAPGEIYSVGSFSPDGKMIAFTSTKSGTKNIWIKQTASGEAIQITKDEFKNESPIWSPDGERLAFFSVRGKQASIWQMPVFGGSPKLLAELEDGSSVLRFWSKNDLIYYESKGNIFAIEVNSAQTKQVTDFDSKAVKTEFISLSQDEKQVAYRTVEGEVWNLWAKNLADNAPKKLVSTAAEIKNTVWHPDNKRILYSSPVDGVFQIFVTDIGSASPKQLTFGESDCLVLDVSSDGTRILYGSAKEESDIWGVNLKDSKEFIVASDLNSELWAAPAPDGKTIAYQSIKNLSQGNKLFNGKILTKTLNSDESPTELVSNGFLPVFSPDGQQIAFMRIIGDKHQISTIKAAGGGQRDLTAGEVVPINYTLLPYNRIQTNYISWSSDSAKIAYISKRSGQFNIWLTNADGSNDVQLTSNNDSNLYLYCPLWSSNGKQIAFTSKTAKRETDGRITFSVLVIDTETKDSKLLMQEKSFMRLVGWSADSNELILASVAGGETVGLQPEVSLLQVEIETGKSREISKLKDTYLYNIHLSPDKKNIAFAAHREGNDNIWLMPAAGGEAKKLTANNDSRLYFSSLAWSPDSNSIFFGKQSRYSLLSMLTNFK
ncbi:MAG TPA: protein kinase [Pyrinomonadaceae bacterium]|nr:protein kinase [Pyrinomonadaceae bacterium]